MPICQAMRIGNSTTLMGSPGRSGPAHRLRARNTGKSLWNIVPAAIFEPPFYRIPSILEDRRGIPGSHRLPRAAPESGLSGLASTGGGGRRRAGAVECGADARPDADRGPDGRASGRGPKVREILAAQAWSQKSARWLVRQAYRKLDMSRQVFPVRQVLAARAPPAADASSPLGAFLRSRVGSKYLQ